MSPRVIHLRRPAVLSVQEGVFVPQGNQLDEVDQRWAALCKANPAYYDGRLYHVLGVHRNGHGGCMLHVIDCAYRFFAVQDEQFDLGVRGLGVKGITWRDDLVLMGLRSARVAAYKDMWEFAPGGSAEPGVDPSRLIQQELREETGLSTVREPTPIAVLFDPVLRCWELVYRLEAAPGDAIARPAEYSQVQWKQPEDLPDGLSPIAKQVAELLDGQS